MTQARAIVLAYGARDYPGVVARVLAEGIAPHDVIVVQNPAAPDEADHPVPDGVRLVRMARNGGYAAAMNAGIAAAREDGAPEWLLLLTHDVEIPAGALRDLLAAAARADGYGILGPRLHWRDPEGDHTTYGGWIAGDGSHGHHHTRRPDVGGISTVDHLDGAALLVRAAAHAQVGPIDERFFLYYEETDYCRRMQQAGWAIGCVVGVEFSQAAGGSRRPGAYGYLMTRNHLEFSRAVGGGRGVRSGFARAARKLPLRRLVRRSTPADQRRWARSYTVGALCGFGAFALRRFGPPPAWLPGLGDVRS